MSFGKVDKLGNSILFAILMSVIVGILVYRYKPSVLVKPYPVTLGVENQSEIACKAQASAFLEAHKDSITREEDGIKASVKDGTDEVTLNIEGDTVKFLTRASFQAGTLDGASFQVVRNDSKYLIAALTYKDNTGIETIIVEKESGLGTWVRNEANSFATNNPDVQAYYLVCR